MRLNSPKQFKTLDEQCDIVLNQRHLQIPSGQNELQARVVMKQSLLKYNYFDLINGLEDVINSADPVHKYYGNWTTNDLFRLYELNKKLGYITLMATGQFEIRLKTSIAYHFASKFRDWDAYRNKLNYRKINKDDDKKLFMAYFGYSKKFRGNNPSVNEKRLFPFFVKDKRQIKSFRNRNRIMGTYGGKPPVWVAIKALDFGQLHTMFSMQTSDVAAAVLADFGYQSRDRNLFESILDVTNWLRNETAHFKMINKSRYHSQKPLNLDLVKNLNLRTNNSRKNLNVFPALCILNHEQQIKQNIIQTFNDSAVPVKLQRKYLTEIGYWRQSGWEFAVDF